MQRIVLSLIAIAGLLLSGVPAMAHHAFATEFDALKPVTMKGIVTKIDWANPHVWFYLNVKTENGAVENWGFEMGGPNSLSTSGWTKETMKIGDEIIVEGSLAKHGRRNVIADCVAAGNRAKPTGPAAGKADAALARWHAQVQRRSRRQRPLASQR